MDVVRHGDFPIRWKEEAVKYRWSDPTSCPPRTTAGLCLVLLALGCLPACQKQTPMTPEGSTPARQRDPELSARGAIELTARLSEIPEGAIFQRDLYNYTTILKYEVLEVQRGDVPTKTIYVGHYNPWLPRSEAADKHVSEIGGNLKQFEAGQVHQLALDVPIDDHFMGGIVNKYFGQETGPLYWAVWTNLAED